MKAEQLPPVTEIEKIGFYNLPIDSNLDLVLEIEKLKKEKNAVVLAHYYQDSEIQDVADFVGDSLGLAQEAERTNADLIAFAGVHFMAETASILNPNKKVVIPDLKAGCSLSDSCPPEKFKAFISQYPDHLVVSYINCSAEVKALTDIIVTSTNAVPIINSLPKDQKIIFAPDLNLGRFVEKQCGRKMVLWNGACMVHEIFSKKKIVELKTRFPDALLIAHPECEEAVLALADHVASTTGLINYSKKSNAKQFIVATEAGILHQMKKASPGKEFIPAPSNSMCACNDCPHMKLNTMEKLYLCMKYELPEVKITGETQIKALRSIKRMLEMSKELGL